MRDHNNAIDELYQAYLVSVYEKLTLPATSKATDSLTYGEMLYPSVKKVLTTLSLRPEDIFLDLGSGLGKFAIQVFMQSQVQQVIGIEMRTELSESACEALQMIKQEFPIFWEKDRKLQFLHGDFLKLNWEQATIAYCCATCFRPELLNAIGDKLNQETSVQQVLSLRPLPTLTRLPLKKVFTVECSWDSALCYYYSHRS
jgi:SAM-dependent methyltransferase